MFLRKYGTGSGSDVIIPMIKRGVVDFAVTADWTPASGDVKVSKDGGTEANIGTLPVINGTTGWKFVFSDAELQCKSLTVRVVDSATKAVEDQFFIVETFGHASAMFPVDLSASVLPVNVTHFGGTAGTFASGIPDVKTASIATDAVNAAALAANAVAEIQSGLATAAHQTLIKAKTDQLTFTTENKVDSTAVLDPSARVKLHGTQDDYAPLKASDYTAPLNAASTRTALGMATADLDTQLDAILAAASAGAGTGARTVTITVNDGTNVLQNAVVRFTEGSNTYRAITNASGVATFNLDDATYTVAVSKVGYYYAGTTMVVNGTETATYSMTAVNVTPGTGDLTTGYLTCLDEEGAAEQGVSVRCQVVQVPASGTGFAYDSAVQLATSDADGLVEFPMVKGARYLVWRGSIKPPQGITPILISASAGSTTALGSLIGD